MAKKRGNRGSRAVTIDSAPSKKWTVAKLKDYIRKVTSEVNKRINNYRKSKHKHNPAMDKQIESLQNKVGVKGRKGREIVYGFESRTGGKRTYKNKEQLLSQARKLRSFKAQDVYSQNAEFELNERAKKAKETFNNTYGYDLSDEEYDDWVHTLDSIGSDVLSTFSYMALLDAYIDARRDGKKISMKDIVDEVTEESEGKGWDKMQFTDRIVKAFNDALNTQ